MSESTNYLTCKRVKYYSLKDKEAFFEWVRKLEWIHDVTEANGDVIIDLCSGDLDQFDLLDLIAILRRYQCRYEAVAKACQSIKQTMDYAEGKILVQGNFPPVRTDYQKWAYVWATTFLLARR